MRNYLNYVNILVTQMHARNDDVFRYTNSRTIRESNSFGVAFIVITLRYSSCDSVMFEKI